MKSVYTEVRRPVREASPRSYVGAGVSVGGAIAGNDWTVQATGGINPPFALTSRHNRLVDDIPQAQPEILRGYIRRAHPGQDSDPYRYDRLRFMYNPQSIQRSYLSYLDQLSLDPSNSVFGSENAATAPGIIDFDFELFFDRHLEASWHTERPGTPMEVIEKGVLVDHEFFDRVIRGVTPGESAAGVADNGIMFVSPGMVSVVFSPTFVVTGRPYNATISFNKFTHRMTPTRMSVAITMKAIHIGEQPPVADIASTARSNLYQATVPYQFAQVTSTYKNFAKDLTWDNYVSSSLRGILSSAHNIVSTAADVFNGSAAGSLPAGDVAQVMEAVWKYMRGKGLTPEQTAGIMGNMKSESGYNPDRQQDGGPAYGIVQWENPRQSGMRESAAAKGVHPGDLGHQLDYIWYEFMGTEAAAYAHLKTTTTVRDATISFCDRFERPSIHKHEERVQNAVEAFRMFAGK
jgi:hypothetical protein